MWAQYNEEAIIFKCLFFTILRYTADMSPSCENFFTVLKRPFYATFFVLSAGGIFGIQWKLFEFLPVSGEAACSVVGHETSIRLVLAALFSILFALNLLGVLFLGFKKRLRVGKELGVGVLGTLLSFFALFCAACALPILGLAGAATVFAGLSPWSPLFQTSSLALLCFGLWLVSKKLNECPYC